MSKIGNPDRIRKACLGEIKIPVPTGTGGVKSIKVLGWYHQVAKRVTYRVALELARTHKGRVISFRGSVDWPTGRNREEMQAHLQALGAKYLRQYRAGEWPVVKNYAAHCNPRARRGFTESNCPGCPATYCTVER